MRGLSHIAEEEELGLESPQYSKKFMDVKARIYNKLFSSKLRGIKRSHSAPQKKNPFGSLVVPGSTRLEIVLKAIK